MPGVKKPSPPLYNKLLTYRWLLVIFLVILNISFELFEHRNDFHSLNLPFVLELLLFAIATPALIGLILHFLSASETKRWQSEVSQSLFEEISQQIISIDNWDELCEILVRFPTDIIKFSHTFFYLQKELHTHTFDLISENHVTAQEQISFPKKFDLNTTAHAHQTQLHPFSSKQIPDIKIPYGFNPFCLPLRTSYACIGMLHLILPNSYQLGENEIGIFNALIPTIISSIIRLAPFSPDNVIVSEKERIMLARQLHDTVGQNLGFLLLKLEEFKSVQALSAQSERTVDEMRLIADQAYEQIRDTLTTLKPIKIQELAPTLYQVAMAIASHQPALAVQMSQDGQPFDIPIDKMQHIIDICREAFTNVVKHAQATKIEINIYWQIDMLTISIKDNGLGIHTKTKELESFGMQMMFERASEIDGKIQLNSQPAKGLEVLLQLLLP